MKFLLGFLTGAVTILLVSFLIGIISDADDRLTLFPQSAGCVTRKNLKVFHSLPGGNALVEEVNPSYDSPLMLLVGENERGFYDDEVVKVPVKQCAKQIGTYRYKTRDGFYKTVPAVTVEQG